MKKLTKKMKIFYEKVDRLKRYDFEDGISIIKKISSRNFIESVDISIFFSFGIKKNPGILKGSVILPHGTGKNSYVVVFAQKELVQRAKDFGADLVGMEDILDQVKKKIKKIDFVVSSPYSFSFVRNLGQLLGPYGLMPDQKEDTVTDNLEKSIKDAKFKKVNYTSDRNSCVINGTIGKINFKTKQLKENLESFLSSVKRRAFFLSKKFKIEKINLSTTMGIGIRINHEMF